MNNPRASGISRVGLGVANVPFAAVDELGLAIPVDISQDGDLALDTVNHRIFVPTPPLAFRIDVELHTRATPEHDGDDVGPAVSSEVGGKLHRGIGGELSGWTRTLGKVDL